MQGRYEKIVSLIMLVFLGVFNLALPLPTEAGRSGTCSMRHCCCNSAMKTCCCCKNEALDGKRDTFTCLKTARCMDGQEMGIVCHGLSHPTLVTEDIAFPVFAGGNFLVFHPDDFHSSVYTDAIEKPPRLS
jgi:hypothetical protein